MSTIVMTGGSSGFGAIAARRMLQSPDTRLLLGSRRPADFGESVTIDLESLDSVRAFAAEIQRRIGASPIDRLVLNAGLIRPDDTSTSHDGFETTFAVNHLAHYLLTRLLLPSLAPTAVIVMTTSGTHDPANRTGLVAPRHTEVDWLCHPDRDPDRSPNPREAGQHAYTVSKLCTILTARTIATLPDVRERGIRVVAYDPGQVFGTGLARDLALPLRLAWSIFGRPVLGWPVRRLNPSLNTRDDAGRTLADLTTGHISIPAGQGYVALRRGHTRWTEPSTMAQDEDRGRRLWEESARLVGLPA